MHAQHCFPHCRLSCICSVIWVRMKTRVASTKLPLPNFVFSMTKNAKMGSLRSLDTVVILELYPVPQLPLRFLIYRYHMWVLQIYSNLADDGKFMPSQRRIDIHRNESRVALVPDTISRAPKAETDYGIPYTAQERERSYYRYNTKLLIASLRSHTSINSI